MVLAIAIELVVESAQIDFDGKFGIEREHAANMPGGAGLIAKHFRAKRHFSASCIVGYHFDAAEHTSPNPPQPSNVTDMVCQHGHFILWHAQALKIRVHK
jgi:hypothetical protein